tara:strand:- start:146 stop:565 length:420 start_codon:yes stop_codon:yes gene_type:complete
MKVEVSILEPIRENLSWEEKWRGPDNGLIICWENGRRFRQAVREGRYGENNGLLSEWESIQRGELPWLAWKGGVFNLNKPYVPPKNKPNDIIGSWRYLAELQGWKEENLSIDTEAFVRLTCTKTEKSAVFQEITEDSEI